MFSSEEIAARIKEKAKQQKTSVNQMLIDCGLGRNTITKMSEGTDILTQNFAKIADCLNCSADYLLGRTLVSTVVDLPEEFVNSIIDMYNNKEEKFISETDFIIFPSVTFNRYAFYADAFDSKYMKIYEAAFTYAKEKGLDIIDKEKYMNKLLKFHDDVISRAMGKYYTFKGQKCFNMFHEVYKLYVKAYTESFFDKK